MPPRGGGTARLRTLFYLGGVVKGIVFNLLADVVSARHGEAVWDDLLDAAGASGAYTSLGSYPDEELMGLVAAAAQALGQTPAQVLRDFGRDAMPLLVQRYGGLFAPHRDTRSFLLTLNAIIHAEVRKLSPGATPPDFDIDASDPELLRMVYRSERRLCALAEGFIEGAAREFGERVDGRQLRCMHRGDDCCEFVLRFAREADAGGRGQS